MTVPRRFHKIGDRTPAPVFKSIEEIERVKSMMLGQPIPKIAYFMPYGYEVDPENPKMLKPINRHFALLWMAKHHLRSSSYYEVAAWLSKASGKRITHTGLHKLLRQRPPLGTVDSNGQFIPASPAGEQSKESSKSEETDQAG
jgi:hypothetical protein